MREDPRGRLRRAGFAPATALSLAVARKAHGVVAALLDARVALGDAPVVYAESLPTGLVEKLIERGVPFDASLPPSAARGVQPGLAHHARHSRQRMELIRARR